MKVIVFNPIVTHFEMCRLLKKNNINFEICFFTDKLDDNCIVKREIEDWLSEIIKENNFHHYIYDENNFSFSSDDLLIPCDDRSAKLVDRLLCEKKSIFSDDPTLLEIRLEKKKYLKYLSNDILDDLKIPCIIKPTLSAGGHNTHFVTNEDDLEKIKNLNIPISEMIIQKMYHGDEYSVDIISKNGKHYLIGIWKYTKKENSTLRTKIELLSTDDKILINRIFDYVSACLDRVGKRNGATHSEVIISGTDINLIEINFRFHGHSFHEHYIKGTDDSHFSAFIKLFIKDENVNVQYECKNYVVKILVNLTERLNLPNINYREIETLASVVYVVRHSPIIPNTSLYGPTVDVRSCLCYIMAYYHKGRYEQDINMINLWIGKINAQRFANNQSISTD